MRRARPRAAVRRLLAALSLLVLLGALGAGLAQGERSQHGNLVISLDGGFAPRKLPRDRLAPVAVRLEGGLTTTDGSLLPRVTRIELGLPGQGKLTTYGLPICHQRRIRNALPPVALATCRSALVGRGDLRVEVSLPHQPPFQVHASALAFNGVINGRRGIILHVFSPDPPSVVVLPFLIRLRSGRLGTTLVADLPPWLGPWPHFAHFRMTLARNYTYRGQHLSYLSASCPIPRRAEAGYFSFARSTYTLDDGREVGTTIPRSCRAR